MRGWSSFDHCGAQGTKEEEVHGIFLAVFGHFSKVLPHNTYMLLRKKCALGQLLFVMWWTEGAVPLPSLHVCVCSVRVCVQCVGVVLWIFLCTMDIIFSTDSHCVWDETGIDGCCCCIPQ